MVFSSLLFLFRFLPIVLLLYFVVPKRAKNLILLITSLFFYAWGEPKYVLLMVFSIVINFYIGMAVARAKDAGNTPLARWLLVLSAVLNLLLLGIFKYADLLISTFNSITGAGVPLLKLPLPIGISFYTFQAMSYAIDVYRGQTPMQKNIISFGSFVTLFPQLIAGPIIEYNQVDKQLSKREESIDKFGYGIWRFTIGLAKKVLIANNVGSLFDEVSGTDIATLSALGAWLGIIAFSLQIYFDFSGYSDMAVGLGKMLGFDFLENFNYPYISKSITEFWRRWHISLGSWFRDYVYIPLGGNRRGLLRQIINISIVWLLTGIWHGASWNFLLWGGYFGIILILEKLFLLKLLKRLPSLIARLYSIPLIIFGWVIFAFEDMGKMSQYFGALFGKSGILYDSQSLYWLYGFGVTILIGVLASTPAIRKLRPIPPLRIAIAAVLLILSTAYIVDSTYNPFLYFRF